MENKTETLKKTNAQLDAPSEKGAARVTRKVKTRPKQTQNPTYLGAAGSDDVVLNMKLDVLCFKT